MNVFYFMFQEVILLTLFVLKHSCIMKILKSTYDPSLIKTINSTPFTQKRLQLKKYIGSLLLGLHNIVKFNQFIFSYTPLFAYLDFFLSKTKIH